MHANRKCRRPQPRSLIFIPVESGPAPLILRAGRMLAGYFLLEVASPMGGRCFRLEKAPSAGGETYHVRATGPRAATCDCKGHFHRGHCKHADAILTLIDNGRLLPAAAQAAA